MPEVSDIFIKLNYWYLNNRRDLKRWWVLLLIALDIFLVVFVATNGVVAAFSYKQADEWINEIGTSRVLATTEFSRISPQPLDLGQVESFTDSLSNTISLSVVTNKNALWSAEKVIYTFIGSEGESAERTAVLVPQATTVFLSTSDVGSDQEVNIKSITWRRSPVDSLPVIPITFTDGEHTTVITPDAGGAKAISQIATTITNNSLFTVKETRVVVLVRKGSTLVAAKQVFVDNLTSREARDLSIQFSGPLPQFDTIIFFSDIDIFDPNMLEV